MELNDTAREQLRSCGISPTQWAQQNFGTDEWHGDACGCTDDRCIGFHHDDANDCSCLTVLLTTSPERLFGTSESDSATATPEDQTPAATVAPTAGHEPRRPFIASFEGWTPDPEDLELWPNSVRIESVEGYDPTFTGEVTDADLMHADFGEVRNLVEIDTNYKPSRDGNPVRLTRTDAARLAAAVLEAIGDTFTSRHLGSLRTGEAVDLMLALEAVATTLQRLRWNALVDLAEELEPEDDDVDDAATAGENEESGPPVSKSIPALAQPADIDEPPAGNAAELAEPEAPLAEDSGEVTWTLEQQFGDALGALFPRDLHEIASSDAYSALKYKVLHRCQVSGETPTQVLATVSASDRAFVARANDPAAFLASRIQDDR